MRYLLLFVCLIAYMPFAASAQGNLSAAQKNAVGKKIWQNESGGTVDGLTAWNAGENFPSLGIGHFIWYPAGQRGPFTESWPQFISYAVKRGANPPEVARRASSPWNSRAEFQSHFKGAEMKTLRAWLAGNVALQTDFIIAKSRASLPKILAAAPANDRGRISNNYEKVGSTANGTYALIDYVNFKGEGINPNERYNGKGWGLLQVLGNMKESGGGQASAREFANSAKFVLSRRIDNAPNGKEKKWRAGWLNRCETYAHGL